MSPDQPAELRCFDSTDAPSMQTPMQTPTYSRRGASRLIAGTLAAGLLGLTRCREPSADDQLLIEERKRGFIAFVGAGPSDPLWPILQAGGRKFRDLPSTMRIEYFNPAGDAAKDQVELLANIDDPDLRGICVQIKDLTAVGPQLARLYRSGLPIVSMVQPARSNIRFAHVGLDNMAIGTELARAVVETLGEAGGSIMVVRAGLKHPIFGPRYMAFDEAIRRESRIAVFAEIDCEANPVEARRLVRERSRRYPRLDLWVAMADWLVQTDGLDEELFSAQTRFVTVGGYPRQWPLIERGRIARVVAADYGQIGQRAIQYCLSAIREPLIEQRALYVDLRHVTPANLEAYRRDWKHWLE